MVTLLLARHAKSDWGDPGLSDHDRPLNARGTRDAPRMAKRLAEADIVVHRLISSTAVRARTTAAAFGAALGVQVELDPELYLATAQTLLVKVTESDTDAVLLVAHDPGLSELASHLSDGGISHMPSGAVAHFVWRVESWADAIPYPADVWTFDTPRDGTS